jgi:hypothetical protein
VEESEPWILDPPAVSAYRFGLLKDLILVVHLQSCGSESILPLWSGNFVKETLGNLGINPRPTTCNSNLT